MYQEKAVITFPACDETDKLIKLYAQILKRIRNDLELHLLSKEVNKV